MNINKTILAMMFLFPSVCLADFSSIEDAAQAVVHIIVEVERPDGTVSTVSRGTGFVVSEQGDVLTARHILEHEIADGEKLLVSGALASPDNSRITLYEVLGVALEADVEHLRFNYIPGKNYSYFKFNSDYTPEINSDINLKALGFTAANTLFETSSPVTGITGNGLVSLGNVAFTNGMSGGPVTDSSYRVVGLIHAGEVGREFHKFFIPIENFSALLANLPGVSIGSSASGQELEWTIKTAISVSGERTKEISASGYYAIENGSTCTESNTSRHFDVCLPAGSKVSHATLTEVAGTGNHRETYELHSPTDNCARLTLWYADRGRNFIGDCRGHGRSRARLTVYGLVTERVREPKTNYSQKINLSEGSPLSTSITYDGILDNLENLAWAYVVNISNNSGTNVTLTEANPVNQRFSSLVNNDGRVIVFENEN